MHQKNVDACGLVFLLVLWEAAHHQYPPVALPVDAPQLDVGLGLDGGGPRGPVDQRQLPEAAALADAGHPFVVDVHLEERKARERKALSHYSTGISLSFHCRFFSLNAAN